MYLPLLCFALIIFACTKTESPTVNNLEKEANASLVTKVSPTIGQSSMLKFSSQEDLTKKIGELRSNQTPMSLKSINGEGFTSYFDVHQQLVNDDSKEKELLENSIITPDGDSYNLVPDKAFASLLNSNLEIEVADKIYRITRFGTYIIDLAQYNVATAMIDSLYKSNTRLSQTRKFAFEIETDRPDYYQAATGILRLDTYKAFETGAIKESMAVKAGNKSTLNNQVTPNLVNPRTIPPGNIVYTDYTNDKVFNYWNSKKRMRANWSEYNWASALFLAVEVTTQKKGWTGFWRELSAWETNIINNGVVMDRVPDYSSPLVYDIPAHYAQLESLITL